MRIPLVALAVVACSSQLAVGQCRDWMAGYGPNGNGSSVWVSHIGVLDFGAGPRLTAAGMFTGAQTGLAQWTGSSWDAVANAPVSVLTSATFDDGNGPAAYLGGTFLSGAGIGARHIVKWNGSAWQQVGTGTNNWIYALTAFDDGNGMALYAGGNFVEAGGISASRVARWRNGTWEALGSGINGNVRTLCIHDDGSGNALYAGGQFTLASGVAARCVAKWTGSSWVGVGSSLPQSPVNEVYALASFNDGSGSRLYAGGTFSTTRWDGQVWSTVGAATPIAGVRALASFDDGSGTALYASGVFLQNPQGGLIQRWNGTTWASLGSGLNSTTGSPDGFTLCPFNDGQANTLWVAGEFTSAGGKPSRHIGRWGVPCSGPSIVSQPTNTAPVLNQALLVTVEATGTEAVTYQWRKNGQNLANDARISGATTDRLRLQWWSYNDAGDYDVVASNFMGTVTSDAVTVTIPLQGQSGPVEVAEIVVPPEPVPGQQGLFYLSMQQAQLAQTGEVVFGGTVGTSGPGAQPHVSLWTEGEITLIALNGELAPGTESGTKFGSELSIRAGAAGGRVAFIASLFGPSVQSTNNEGLWYRSSQGIELVARKGQDAAGFAPGVVYSDLERVQLADSGRIVFIGRATGPGVPNLPALWARDPGQSTTLIARSGGAVPGTSTPLGGDLVFFDLNASGEVVFHATLANGITGIWAGPPQAMQMVGQAGSSAPGFPAGSTVTGFEGLGLVMSADAKMCVWTRVQTPTGTQRGIYQIDGTTLSPVVLSGTPVAGTPNNATFLDFESHGINAAGTVVLTSSLAAVLSGPSHGLFVRDSAGLATMAFNTDTPAGAPSGYYFDFGEVPIMAMNELNHVVFQCKLSGGEGGPGVYGWTRATGIFPIAVPGTQLEIAEGVYRTTLQAFVAQKSTATPRTSTCVNDAGTVVIHVRFTDQTNGIFQGSFPEFAGAFHPCPAVLASPQD